MQLPLKLLCALFQLNSLYLQMFYMNSFNENYPVNYFFNLLTIQRSGFTNYQFLPCQFWITLFYKKPQNITKVTKYNLFTVKKWFLQKYPKKKTWLLVMHLCQNSPFFAFLWRFCLKLNKKNQTRHSVLFTEWLYRQNKDNNKIRRFLHWFFMVNKNVYWWFF